MRLYLFSYGILVILMICVASSAQAETLLASPVLMLKTSERMDFVGANKFTVESGPSGSYLRSRPQRSASGLYQKVSVPHTALSKVRWSWRVNQMHKSADVTKYDREDFAAKVAFVFGEPSFWSRDVPTLAYVWTSTPVADGTVIRSSRLFHLRYVQLHGKKEHGMWHRETRNVIADFKAVFGYERGQLHYIAIFNDNDQTEEPVSASFGKIVAHDGR